MTTPPARERLLDAPDDLFYNHGFHSVGLDRVIEVAGVTKTTFYNHFESKDDLIIQTLAQRDVDELNDWVAIMKERGGDDPRACMLALTEILREWFQQEGFRGCIFINAAIEFPIPTDPVHIAAASHGQHLYEIVLDLAKKAGAERPELLSRQLLMLISGALISRHVALDHTAAETARATAELLLEAHLGPARLPA